MKKLIFSMAALLSTAAVFAFAPASNWQVATGYSVKFVGGGEVGGIFKTFKGTIAFDEQNLATSSFDLSIDVASINTGNGLMNTHAKGAEWFDAGKYPVIHFVSKKITKAGAGYQVTGDMEMHGVKKELTLPFTFQGKGNTATFKGQFTVNRNDFHIGKPGGDVSENIKLDLSVPVVKK
ncbi:MAG: YceI family protein [Flavipsychrobacter sp.]|nr:YceI family protein [Flavipsychrobacter sp.]